MRILRILAAIALTAVLPGSARAKSFYNFESGQVRPMALSPDGSRLYVVNTPDNQLEIFSAGASGLTHLGAVPVGLEPVAVAAKNDGEVWVVNHLSDSVSIVDVTQSPPRVIRTLLTCDEPRDIVFAGPANGRAFITTARRGQNCPLGFAFQNESTPRAVVQVYDDTSLDTTLPGTPIANVALFGDTPRALARSADGNTVYAAIFHSGNQTTTLGEPTVCDGGAASSACGAFPGGLPAPNVNIENIPGPEVGLIAKFNRLTNQWEDSIGRNWNAAVSFDLPDLDVFAIDAAAPVPIEQGNFAHVGTEIFNLAVNPVSGTVYASNTEARNEVRFEGPGLAFNSTTVQGHLHEARITVLQGTNVLPRHLNKHIDYAQRPALPGVKEKSLATPLEMAVTADGSTLFVAAFGSSRVGVFSTAALENDTFVPDAASHIAVSGGGPSGLVLDEARGRLYVATRFDAGLSVIDLTTRTEVSHQTLHNPEPAEVRNGRRFLYDAAATSSNGEASCSSCHTFGDLDQLAWDLGNPDDVVLNNPLPFKIPPINGVIPEFHPLKGPMTTQSLRGMANNGSMHWRGDRTGGNDPGGDVFDEDAAFKKFNVAFPGLIGRDSELTAAEMQAFADFALTMTYPPNPIRALDNTLNANQQQGHDLYFGRLTDVLFNCNGCHTLDPSLGQFGTSGFSTFEGETQMIKVPHLRNVYQKVGMFGRPGDAPRGPQIRGFGFLHDGSIDTIRRFLGASVFSLTNAEQNDLERFVMVFDSDLHPIVGQQVTLDAAHVTNGGRRLDLLLARTDALECDLVVKGIIDGVARGGVRLPDGTFQMDRAVEIQTEAALRTLSITPGNPSLTYTCVPPGTGLRTGVDRDEDGVFDRDELDRGSDPADGSRTPPTLIGTTSLTLRDDATAPIDPARRRMVYKASRSRGVASGFVAPLPGSNGDPTSAGAAGGGAELVLYNTTGGAPVSIALPAAQWARTGFGASAGYRYRDKLNGGGPISSVAIKGSEIRIRGRGQGLYSLAGAPQGAMVVRIELGAATGFCSVIPPRAPASKHDTTTQFIGARNTPAPGSCPLPPG